MKWSVTTTVWKQRELAEAGNPSSETYPMVAVTGWVTEVIPMAQGALWYGETPPSNLENLSLLYCIVGKAN